MATPTPSDAPTASLDASGLPSCTTAVPGQYGNVPPDACNSNYSYDPQFAPAVAVAVIFGIFTVTHIALAFIYRKRYTWPLIMGALWELIAYIFAALGAHDQQSTGFATGRILLTFLAPLWINAFVYMTVARMVYCFVPDHRVRLVGSLHLRGDGISKWFIWADVLTFLIQAGGASMAGPDQDANVLQWGLHVYMIGIGIQQLCILVFVGVMIAFWAKMRAVEQVGGAWYAGTHDAETTHALAGKRPWRPLLYVLFGVLLFITIRIIYRMIEFGGGIGPDNPVPRNEVYSYALDALPMMIALLLLAVWHPGRTLVGPDSEFPKKTRAEKKAAKAEKKAAKAEKKKLKQERKYEKEEAKKMRKAARKGVLPRFGTRADVAAEMGDWHQIKP